MHNLYSPTPWISVPTRNPHASIRLFCFHYAGGSATVYHRWGASLPPSVEVCAVQMPGRGARRAEPLLGHVEEVLEPLAHAMEPYLDRPFAFFGHSMGALLCFELARYLRAQRGHTPAQVFVSGRRAAHLPSHTMYHTLADKPFLDRLRVLNGTPPAILEDAELMSLMLPVLRADFALCETYRYTAQPPLECPLFALGGLQDVDVSYEHLQAWSQHTSASFHAAMFPGDHFFLQPQKMAVLGLIARQLQQHTQPVARVA